MAWAYYQFAFSRCPHGNLGRLGGVAHRTQQLRKLTGHAEMRISVDRGFLALIGNVTLGLEFPIRRQQKVSYLLFRKRVNPGVSFIEGFGQTP